MRGGLASVAVYCVGLSTAIGSPSDADLRIVAQHEPVRAWLDRFTVNPHVSADEAVDHAVGQVADARALEHDAVLDLGILNHHVVADRGERADVGVHDARAAPDDGGTTDHGALDHRALLDHHFSLDAAFRI